MISSESIFSEDIEMSIGPGEFSGTRGHIQPLPHEMDGAERARMERAVDPMDEGGTADTELARRRANGELASNPE